MRSNKTLLLHILVICSLTTLSVTQITDLTGKSIRYSVQGNVDYALVGNLLGHNCNANSELNGTANSCGTSLLDQGIDVWWKATTSSSTTSTSSSDAQTFAQLTLPSGATVKRAYLYWASITGSTATAFPASPTITFITPSATNTGVPSLSTTSSPSTLNLRHGVADVTSYVTTSGLYGVTAVPGLPNNIGNLSDAIVTASWWMVVFYDNPTPSNYKTFVLFDQPQTIFGSSAEYDITNFPDELLGANVALAAIGGIGAVAGDTVTVNNNTLTETGDVNRASNDFFVSARTKFAVPQTNIADKPQYSGKPDGQGLDLVITNITSLAAGRPKLGFKFQVGTGDGFALGSMIVSLFFPATCVASGGSPTGLINGDNASTWSCDGVTRLPTSDDNIVVSGHITYTVPAAGAAFRKFLVSGTVALSPVSGTKASVAASSFAISPTGKIVAQSSLVSVELTSKGGVVGVVGGSF